MTATAARRYLAYAAAIGATALILGVFSGSLVRAVVQRDTYIALTESALLTERVLESTSPPIAWQPLAERLGSETLRLTFIRDDGVVLGDSRADPAALENHAEREEVREALAGRRGQATRRSASISEELAYVALPLRAYGGLDVIVRASAAVTVARAYLARSRLVIGLASLGALILVALVTYLTERRMIEPIQKLQRAAAAYAQGRFDYGLHVAYPPDLAQVAASMSSMASALKERVALISAQTAELEAVLASMVEAVIVLDRRRRIRSLNASASRLAGTDSASARGRSLLEVFHNTELDDFAREVLDALEPRERTVTIERGAKLHLQAHGTRLAQPGPGASPPEAGGSAGESAGAIVLVLHDVTQVRRLDQVRRDFVANVSHELKTPITAIRGYLETLADGGMEDAAKVAQFTKTASRHADRLGAIVDDLLSLAALEERADVMGETENCDLEAIARGAMESRAAAARLKAIALELEAGEPARVRGNPRLLEQALSNLIDNAVKYTDPGGKVSVKIAVRESQVLVSVADTGIGIDSRHLPRIFERFYRVDKARSRDLGGTGLGLSVVKHIALAHGGKVEASSAPGRGSTFLLTLPLLREGR